MIVIIRRRYNLGSRDWYPQLYHLLHDLSTKIRKKITGQYGSKGIIFCSGTPEVCLLPAGLADKNKLVLNHPLYVCT